MIKANTWVLGLVATAALAACGGGGSDATATPSAVTIAGTAAKGAALAGAAVSIKCAAGTGTATTGNDGKYTVTIIGANLPCALKVVGTDGSVFHSVVAGTGSTGSFAANITPLTEMLLARLAGATPGTFYAGFGAGTSVSAAALTDAIAYVRAALAGATDLTVNPATDVLVVGDLHDQKIDAAMARLASIGVTLQQAIAAIVANPAAPDVVAAPLRLGASDCAWLKSGKYRMINPYETDPKWKAHVLSIDAAARTAVDQDGATISFTSDGACQYTVDDVDSTNKVMVSQGGVLVVHSQSKTNAADRSVAIGLPEQTLPVSELAGTWNIAGWDADSGIAAAGSVATTDEITVNASGQITAVSECLGLAACVAQAGPFPTFATHATSGGFNLLEAGTAAGRVFLYKTLAGKAAFVFVSNDGLQFIVGTRKETLGTLPAVGTVSNFREFSLNGNGTVTPLTANTVTVNATDPVAKTVTRIRTADSRVDTLGYDKPRDGLRYRALNSCTINNVASNCSETVQVPLQGMGITLALSVGTNPTTAFYNITVGKPN